MRRQKVLYSDTSPQTDAIIDEDSGLLIYYTELHGY